MNRFYTAALTLVVSFLPFGLASAEDLPVRLVGTCKISGTATDSTGLHQPLVPDAEAITDEIPAGRVFYNDMFGGISAIAWSGKKDIYWMLPDRGPLDGAVDWSCRVHQVRISIAPEGKQPIVSELLSTVLLRDNHGNPYTGNATAFEADETHSYRLRP